MILALMTDLYNVNPRKQEHEDRTMELGEARSPLCTQRSWSCSFGHRESLPHPHHHCFILRSDLCPPYPRSRGSRKSHVCLALTSHLYRLPSHYWLRPEITCSFCRGLASGLLHCTLCLQRSGLWPVGFYHTARQRVRQDHSSYPESQTHSLRTKGTQRYMLCSWLVLLGKYKYHGIHHFSDFFRYSILHH